VLENEKGNKIFNEFKRRAGEDFHVGQEAGIPNVFCIPVVTGGNTSIIRGRPVMTFYLGKTSDARPHQVSESIFRDYERKTGPIRKHVRPWTNDTHITDKYVNELRELVKISPPQELANFCYTIVILVGLFFISFVIYDHTAEFQTTK